MSEHTLQAHARPAQIGAAILRHDGHLEHVIRLLVVGFPLGRVDELVRVDVMQQCLLAAHFQPGNDNGGDILKWKR